MGRMIRLLCLLVTFLLSPIGALVAQNVPAQFVNTWHYATGDNHQKITFYDDGQYVLYFDTRSEAVVSPTCQQTSTIFRGTAVFGTASVTLTEQVVRQIVKPGCETNEDNFIQDYRPEQVVYPVAYDSLLEALTFNGVIHTRTRYDDTGLQFIPIMFDSAIPPEIIGEWEFEAYASGMAAFSELTIRADGTFTESGGFGSSTCSSGNYAVGTLEVSDLILTMNRMSGERSPCSGGTYPVGAGSEFKTWWMAYSPTDGDILYIDGSAYTRKSGVSTPPQVGGISANTDSGEARVLFSDDFSSNQFDWETDIVSDHIVTVVDGIYTMTFASGSEVAGWIVAPGFTDWSRAPQFTAPFTYEIEMRGICTACGVELLFAVEEDYADTMAVGYLSDPTEGSFWYLTDGGSLSEPSQFIDVEQLPNPLSVFDSSPHTLKLEVEVNSIAFYIDNRLIGETVGQWETQGTIGLGIIRNNLDSTVYMEFDNVRVTGS